MIPRTTGHGAAALMPALLCAVVSIVYLPSLSGGFLNFDDPWLIEHNPVWQQPASQAMPAILWDLSRETRLTLGAEYLPVRDLNVWLEARVHGLLPQAMRCIQLGLYLLALLLLRGALIRCCGPGLLPELAIWLFALHPAHAESVAWLAGRKDILALLFVAIALYVQAGDGPRRSWWLPLLVCLAGLSKVMGVAVVGLFLAQDLMRGRRIDWRQHAPSWLVALCVVGLSVHVGAAVGMVGEPLGGSRLTAAATMGPVWLRYFGMSLALPGNSSILYEVPIVTSLGPAALSGYGFAAGWLALGWLAFRRGSALWLVAWLWFFVPLAPVSQIIAPLQNTMADRYLWLSVMGSALLVSGAITALWRSSDRPRRLVIGGAVVLLVGHSAVQTLERAVVFSSSILLFADATAKTRDNQLAPYQLGLALDADHRPADAVQAFTLCLERGGPGTRVGRQASNNLAQLWVRAGQYARAETILRRALAAWPRDPKVRRNLGKTLRHLGRPEEAASVEAAGPTVDAPATPAERWLK